LRRFGKQFRRFRHQRRRDFAGEVCLPPRIVWKSIENTVRGRAEFDSVPRRGRGFRFNKRQPAAKKIFDGGFFSGLCFESNE
jgi:hypothetical protein